MQEWLSAALCCLGASMRSAPAAISSLSPQISAAAGTLKSPSPLQPIAEAGAAPQHFSMGTPEGDAEHTQTAAPHSKSPVRTDCFRESIGDRPTATPGAEGEAPLETPGSETPGAGGVQSSLQS